MKRCVYVIIGESSPYVGDLRIIGFRRFRACAWLLAWTWTFNRPYGAAVLCRWSELSSRERTEVFELRRRRRRLVLCSEDPT